VYEQSFATRMYKRSGWFGGWGVFVNQFLSCLLIKEASGFFLFVLAYNLCLAVIKGYVTVEMQPP